MILLQTDGKFASRAAGTLSTVSDALLVELVERWGPSRVQPMPTIYFGPTVEMETQRITNDHERITGWLLSLGFSPAQILAWMLDREGRLVMEAIKRQVGDTYTFHDQQYGPITQEDQDRARQIWVDEPALLRDLTGALVGHWGFLWHDEDPLVTRPLLESGKIGFVSAASYKQHGEPFESWADRIEQQVAHNVIQAAILDIPVVFTTMLRDSEGELIPFDEVFAACDLATSLGAHHIAIWGSWYWTQYWKWVVGEWGPPSDITAAMLNNPQAFEDHETNNQRALLDALIDEFTQPEISPMPINTTPHNDPITGPLANGVTRTEYSPGKIVWEKANANVRLEVVNQLDTDDADLALIKLIVTGYEGNAQEGSEIVEAVFAAAKEAAETTITQG